MVDRRGTLKHAAWLARACWAAAFFAGCAASNVARPTPWEMHIQESRQAYANGSYSDAERTLLVALGDAEAFGSNDLRLAVTLDSLARVYETQDRYAEAEPRYRRALAIREQVLGPAHPDVASILYRLANNYRTQHRDGDAEPLYRRALKLAEKAFYPKHPDVVTILENNALLLWATDRPEEARRLETLARAIRDSGDDRRPSVAHGRVTAILRKNDHEGP